MNGTKGVECLYRRDGRTWRAVGEILHCQSVEEIPHATSLTIALVPFGQIRERGFTALHAGEPILVLVVEELEEIWPEPTSDSEDTEIVFSGPEYSPNDEEYAELISKVIRDEIENGEGSNFLIARSAVIEIENFGPSVAREIFWRLVNVEPNSYVTFCFSDGDTFWIGASPERNVTVKGGEVTMNPICGTLPKFGRIERDELLAFVTDAKEIHELFQVVDEELKMMAIICDKGGRVRGPFLKEMNSVIHTEYVLEGRSEKAPLEIFRDSMFAPTMIGSPLENAARVIARHERESRGYYSSAFLLLDHQQDGSLSLDSAITIRTIEIGPNGVGVARAGASIVRDSIPSREVIEAKAKAGATLGVLRPQCRKQDILGVHADREVLEALGSRNQNLSRFWMEPQTTVSTPKNGLKAVIIDHEDDFSQMLAHLLHGAGVSAEVRPYFANVRPDEADLFILGPGPGDPNSVSQAKMAALYANIRTFLKARTPFIAVCLSHQALCRSLGMQLVKLDPPLQGVQREVQLFGRPQHVGFYNTFAALAPRVSPTGVDVEADGEHVLALRGKNFVSFQFHLESVLTSDGEGILFDALKHVTGEPLDELRGVERGELPQSIDRPPDGVVANDTGS